MSFQTQEQALFDLLFDEDFLQEFIDDKQGALELYGLTAEEIADFAVIRTDSLKLESAMRKKMLLGQMVKHLPLSFALMSSFTNGLDICQSIIKPYLVQMNGYERLAVFIKQLLLHLEELNYIHENDRFFVEQVVKLEAAMMQQAEQRYKTSPQAESEAMVSITKADFTKKIQWSAFTSAHSLPLAYSLLQEKLCQNLSGADLWQKLQNEPLQIEDRMQLILNLQPKLLITKPVVSFSSETDSEISFKTVELIEGFEPLLKSINGRNSINDLLNLYKNAGADADTLEHIRQGICVLYENNLLRFS
jgi:hypothetical protein